MVLIMKAMREAVLDSSARIKGGKLKVVEVTKGKMAEFRSSEGGEEWPKEEFGELLKACDVADKLQHERDAWLRDCKMSIDHITSEGVIVAAKNPHGESFEC
jgi:hypothetical protein